MGFAKHSPNMQQVHAQDRPQIHSMLKQQLLFAKSINKCKCKCKCTRKCKCKCKRKCKCKCKCKRKCKFKCKCKRKCKCKCTRKCNANAQEIVNANAQENANAHKTMSRLSIFSLLLFFVTKKVNKIFLLHSFSCSIVYSV